MERRSVTAVAPEDIYLIERVGDQSSQSIQFTPDSKAIPAPLEAGTVVGHLTYEDKDLIDWSGLHYAERPSFEMLAEKKSKAFFLKVWWNQFIRLHQREIIKHTEQKDWSKIETE